MFSFIIKGGPVMIPIILGSIIGLAFIIQKLWSLKRVKMDMVNFSNQVIGLVNNNKFKAAEELCQANIRYPLAILYKAALEKKSLSRQDLEKILERLGNNEVHKLEKYLGGLISVIGIEPLLGFLGTITGLIKAFMAWEQAGSNITVNALAGGIYQAMITTAAGLSIAVPYYLFYNYFVSCIKNISHDLTDYSGKLLEAFAEIKT